MITVLHELCLWSIYGIHYQLQAVSELKAYDVTMIMICHDTLIIQDYGDNESVWGIIMSRSWQDISPQMVNGESDGGRIRKSGKHEI